MGNTKDIDKAISELYRASAAASTLWLAANGLSQEHGHVIDYQAKAIDELIGRAIDILETIGRKKEDAA